MYNNWFQANRFKWSRIVFLKVGAAVSQGAVKIISGGLMVQL
jgi:hypothetical protein